ncbi:unnamed protein product [Didymodactylos carnosus]|uniref:Phytanoyl-CoA dioxygenase n=1 Tax=Didymodactylos carnosus TaxID=1234261 RepID=A0A8S2MSK7_9BILA|nr:unnamed protein product [Didymodactylos carnosus]CAF3972349.1 unnamed protein product [Didymodactylos carnosus]
MPQEELKDICCMLQRDGYVHLKNCINMNDINLAVRAINFELGKGISKEDIEKMRINAISFGAEQLRRSKTITNLLHNTCVIKLVEQLYGSENIHLPEYYVQIALRFPQDVDNDTVSYLPWHLDNVQPGGMKGFGLTVGIFLNDTPKPNSGNFTVFPDTNMGK